LRICKKADKKKDKDSRVVPNGKSLLRLATLICMEISEEWEAGKIYLPRA